MEDIFSTGEQQLRFPWPITFPNKIIFGVEKANEVGKEAKSLGGKTGVPT